MALTASVPKEKRWAILSLNEIHRQAKESAGSVRQEFLMISGVTKAERHNVTSEVNNAVSAAGGWIIDHTLFSNIAITLRFSLPSQRLDEWRRRVVAAGVRLDEDSLAKVRALMEKAAPRPADLTVSFNVTFIHDEPDLRREIPAVPG